MSVTRAFSTRRGRQGGVSLIEVLVAVVVLSIGFVGYAALQMLGVRTNNESMYRTQAIALAESMVERMYANRQAINDATVNGGNSLYDGLDSDDLTCGSPPTSCDRLRGGAGAATCSAAQTATWDAYSVFCGQSAGGAGQLGGIQKLLPEGRLSVTCEAGAGGCLPTSVHTVRVEWEEVDTQRDGGAEMQFKTRDVSIQVIP